MEAAEFSQAVSELLGKAGVPSKHELRELPGTGNNRAFEVRSASGKLLLKEYFHHPRDPRDRLGTEYRFSELLWEKGITSIAQPHAADPVHKLGLYQFIEGRPCAPADVTEERIQECLKFLSEINHGARHGAERALALASEPCLSINEHLDCIERRVQRLQGIDESTEIGKAATNFVAATLLPLWEDTKEAVTRQAMKKGASLSHVLTLAERLLSPSDLGFHNALITPSGELFFVDFEYAGWDDPARTTSDYFCQPRVPVPLRFRPLFTSGLETILPNPERYRIHAELIFPVYQIKWCCIMLADFLPVASERRNFAKGGESLETRRRQQLAKATTFASSITLTFVRE